MARTQRIALTDAPDTYTVLGPDHLPIEAAEEYLQFLRDDGSSPNTVKAYAADLAAWWTVLEHTGTDWQDISTSLFGQFLAYLRTGDLPGTARIGAPEVWLGTASTQLRAAAVLAFYRHHADAHGLAGPYQRLFTSRGKRSRSRYIPVLAGVGRPPRSKDRPIYTVRSGNKSATPVLLPAQVTAILDGCATQTGQDWSGPPSGLRDRLLFAVLAETGMRLGEALSLRHHDFHIGAGGTPFIDVAARQDHPRGARGKTLLARRIYIGDDLEALYSAYVWHLVDQGADLAPRYLFLGVKNQHRGQQPRSYNTYRTALAKLDDCHDLTDSAGRRLRFTQTHRLRHTRATELLNDGVPFHVVQRYLGHKSPEMTARYAATLAATAEAEFLKHKKIGAHGTDISISPSDIYEMTQLGARTDRILPNGVGLLPPLKQCDKGNACLGCGHFATDATHLDELRQQHAATEALLAARRDQYRRRSGRELGEDNIWVIERRRELRSLEAIIDRLSATADQEVVSGAGTGSGKRLPLLQIQTRGAHQSALDKAQQPRTTDQ